MAEKTFTFIPDSTLTGKKALTQTTLRQMRDNPEHLYYSRSTTGDIKLTLKTAPDSGWIMADDGTIGDAGSGATNRANADCEDLFTLLWNNISDTYAPVSTGRGASAAADWAAGKTIQVGTILGRALGVAGAGSGLTSRALGEALGEEDHVLTEAELAAHTHGDREGTGGTGSNYPNFGDNLGTTSGKQTGSAGSGSGHNTMQPTTFVNLMIRL